MRTSGGSQGDAMMVGMVIFVAIMLLVMLFGGPSAVLDSIESTLRSAVEWAAQTVRTLVG